MALTEEERSKIIEEEELRAKTRQKIQNEYEKENEYSTDSIWAFYWFDDSPLGTFKAIILTMFLLFVGVGIIKIFE